MGPLSLTILSTLIISSISLIGIFTLALKQKLFNKILMLLVALSAGALMASSFLHLIPESLGFNDGNIFIYVLIGFTLFFVIEKIFFWHHCHDKDCKFKSFGYMNLIGDAFHNFIDGLVLAPAFLTNTNLGVITALSIIIHEIPQEIGDFGVLVYSGFKKSKALLMNFLTALTAVLGGFAGFYLSSNIKNSNVFLIPFTAGGFIYISASDLIPELKKEINAKKVAALTLTFILGMLLMLVL